MPEERRQQARAVSGTWAAGKGPGTVPEERGLVVCKEWERVLGSLVVENSSRGKQ